MNMQTAVSNESVQKMLESDKFKRYEKFYEMCEPLYNSVTGDEYYHTPEDIFAAIENKGIDVSHIVSKEKYEAFKKQIIKDNPICPSIGKEPISKYNLTTDEGRDAFVRDNPDKNCTF